MHTIKSIISAVVRGPLFGLRQAIAVNLVNAIHLVTEKISIRVKCQNQTCKFQKLESLAIPN